jgi:hypothetical protein
MSDDEVTGRRILVVEDEMLIALVIEDALQSIGGEVEALRPGATG